MSVHVASTNCVTELDRCTSVAHTFLHFGVHELALLDEAFDYRQK
jgi:hypothetical protein